MTSCQPTLARMHQRARHPLRAFTLIEVLLAVIVTTMIAAAVVGTISATRVGLDSQDEAAQETARIARVQARLADHLYRARMILAQTETSICLWLPAEPFDSDPENAAAYEEINANELRWYVVDREARTISVLSVTDRTARTAYAFATDWTTLRTTLNTDGQLTSSTVLGGVLEGAFRFTSFDPCVHRRAALELQLDDDHGGLHFELGGIVGTLQRHVSCP